MGQVWTIKGGSRGEREARFLEHRLVGMGWERLPSLDTFSQRDGICEALQRGYPEMHSRSAMIYASQLWLLAHEIEVGDLVVLPMKTTGAIAVGSVSSGYEYRTDLGPDIRHVRAVTWQAVGINRDTFDRDLLASFGAFLTLTRVRKPHCETRIRRVIEAQSL